MSVLVSLQVFTALDVGQIYFSQGKYKDLHSARIQAQKHLNKEVALGNLEKRQDFYCVPGYRGEHKQHSRLLTQSLVKILTKHEAVIFREHSVPTIGLRPDALVLITKENQGLCFILEVIHNETAEYFKQKLTAWQNWPEATSYLTQLFGYEIPSFAIVTTGQQPLFENALTLDDILEAK
jgi:hypothetical protein